jgi:hypothetical protein
MCEIVRRIPLTLTHPAHPALQSKHIGELTKICLVVSSFSPNDGTTRMCAYRADDVGQYLTSTNNRAPPPHADLRARGQDPGCAPTDGVHEHLRVNRTDIEILRRPVI